MQNETKMEKTLIDDCFYVEKKRWGTYQSYDKDGTGIIISLTEDACTNATRQFLKWRQEGFPETTTHAGKVDGKL